MKSYVYILQSIKNNSYYIGSTSNLNRRIKSHNAGYVQATRYKRPYKLVFYQEYNSIKTAQKIELKIKSWKRKDFIEKIIRDRKIKYMGH